MDPSGDGVATPSSLPPVLASPDPDDWHEPLLHLPDISSHDRPRDARTAEIRDEHLDLSRQAVQPLFVSDLLQARPARQSGISSSDRAAQRQHRRDRVRTRGTEALTPGLDADVVLLPIVVLEGGTYAFRNGGFAVTSAEMLFSSSFSLAEKYVWTYLLNCRRLSHFKLRGEVLVDSVDMDDVAASGGISRDSVSLAVQRLEAKRCLSVVVRGNGRTNAYRLHTVESGASTYPTGHPRSARKRLEALLRRACEDGRSREATAAASVLGFSLARRQLEDLLGTVWRRLDRAMSRNPIVALVLSLAGMDVG